jgi:hypothetical protein
MEAGLLARAKARGMTIEDYVLSLVEGTADPTSIKLMRPEERAAAFKAWASAHRATPPLSDEAISRETLYESHPR